MSPQTRSENSYIINDIIPLLTGQYGFPRDDHHLVKVNDVPMYSPSGNKRGGSSIDIVYCHKGSQGDEPLVLVEAKTDHKTHQAALKQAIDYLKNYPIDRKEYAPSGKRPDFLATTVGKDIKFYRWRQDFDRAFEIITDEIEVPHFDAILEHYGLSKGYVRKNLSPDYFFNDFFNELIAIFNPGLEKIDKNIVTQVVTQIYNFLRYGDKHTTQSLYLDLDVQRQKAIYDLFKRYDIVNSLTPELAFEFRKAILRAFQGGDLNQYITDESIIRCVISIIGTINKNERVLDFECGSGGFLAKAIQQNDLDISNVLGIDIDDLPYIVSKTYLAIYFSKIGDEIDRIPILGMNGLLPPDNNESTGWDFIIGNPSAGHKYERDDINEVLSYLEPDLDQNDRPDKYSEYNFSIQKALKVCKTGGKICLLLPEGLFANSKDEMLRKYILKYCKVHAIINLPQGAFEKGTDTKSPQKGKQTSNQKMYILYLSKIKEIIDKDGVEIDLEKQDYPVFMAHIDIESEGKRDSRNISEELEKRLNIVLEQWKEWSEKQELKFITAKERRDLSIDIQNIKQTKLVSREIEEPTTSQKALSKPKTITTIDTDLEGLL